MNQHCANMGKISYSLCCSSFIRSHDDDSSRHIIKYVGFMLDQRRKLWASMKPHHRPAQYIVSDGLSYRSLVDYAILNNTTALDLFLFQLMGG